MVKKIVAVFLIICMIGIVPTYAEDQTENKTYEIFSINDDQFDLLLSNISDISWLTDKELDVIKPGTHCVEWWYLYSDEVVEAVKNDTLVNAYVKSKYPDIEVNDKKIIRPSMFLTHYFNIGDIIWLSTNHGIKIIEFKKPIYPAGIFTSVGKCEWKQEGDLWFEEDRRGDRYDVIYYDTPEEYIEKYRNREATVYVNGETVLETYYIQYRNNRPLMSLRFFMEQCGVDVEWTEKYGGLVKYSNDNLILYSLASCDSDIAEVTMMREDIYKEWEKLVLAGEYNYRLPRLAEYVGEFFLLPCDDGRQLIPRDLISYITELFGKSVEVVPDGDNIYLEIKDVTPMPVLDDPIEV